MSQPIPAAAAPAPAPAAPAPAPAAPAPAPAAPAPAPAPPPAPELAKGTDWAAAAEQVRSTSATVTKAFIALATLLVGSGPLLVKFSKLPPFPASLVAGIAGVAALIGVGIVIECASDVMLPQTPDVVELANATTGALGKLRQHVEDPNGGRLLYLGEDTTISALLHRLSALRLAYANLSVLDAQGKAAAADPDAVASLPASLGDAGARASLSQNLAAARAQIDAINLRLARLMQQASYIKVRDVFQEARPLMFVGAFIAAIGTAVYLGAFGIDLGKDSSSTSASASSAARPGLLIWSPATDAKSGDRPVSDVRAALGLSDPSCNQIPVMVDGKGTADVPWNVTTVPGDLCTEASRAFSIDSGLATIVTATPTDYSVAARTTTTNATWWELLLAGAGGVGVVVFGGWIARRRKTT